MARYYWEGSVYGKVQLRREFMARCDWEHRILQGTVGKGEYGKVLLGREYMARYSWD